MMCTQLLAVMSAWTRSYTCSLLEIDEPCLERPQPLSKKRPALTTVQSHKHMFIKTQLGYADPDNVACARVFPTCGIRIRGQMYSFFSRQMSDKQNRSFSENGLIQTTILNRKYIQRQAGSRVQIDKRNAYEKLLATCGTWVTSHFYSTFLLSHYRRKRFRKMDLIQSDHLEMVSCDPQRGMHNDWDLMKCSRLPATCGTQARIIFNLYSRENNLFKDA